MYPKTTFLNLLSGKYEYSGTINSSVIFDYFPYKVSEEDYNNTADELMERFVRGDSSRTTEGSGLGLNIAKSLVELQKGTFSIAIDGDLFKVGFVLPRTE